MKTHSILINLMIVIFFITSCGEIKKEVAKDQLIGTYMGKVTITVKHSLQNVGLSDDIKESKGNLRIYKKESGDTYIETGDGKIRITGITLASNGTLFSIPNQRVIDVNGDARNIQGFQVAELEGVKYDGMFFSEANILNFGYETIINYEYLLGNADVVVSCLYEFTKIN